MAVTFPLFPDDMQLTADNRMVMTNRQIFTQLPESSEEEDLMRFSNFSSLPTPGNTSISRDLPQGQRQVYNSVKRPLGSQLEQVNTYEKFYKRSAVEESIERAKRAAVPPRKPKGYVYPTERVKATLHAKEDDKPKINEERLKEYRKRREINRQEKQTIQPSGLTSKGRQGDLFSKEDADYFRQKRDTLFDRGI